MLAAGWGEGAGGGRGGLGQRPCTRSNGLPANPAARRSKQPSYPEARTAADVVGDFNGHNVTFYNNTALGSHTFLVYAASTFILKQSTIERCSCAFNGGIGADAASETKLIISDVVAIDNTAGGGSALLRVASSIQARAGAEEKGCLWAHCQYRDSGLADQRHRAHFRDQSGPVRAPDSLGFCRLAHR